MDISNFYASFFNTDDRYLPYPDERAYIKDLLALLSVKLTSLEMILQGNYDEERAASDVKNAKMHISARLRVTGDSSSFLWINLCDKLNLNDWDQFILISTFAMSEDIRFFKTFGISDPGALTYQLVAQVYTTGDKLTDEDFSRGITRQTPLFKYIIDTSDNDKTSPSSFTMRISPRVYEYLYGRSGISSELEGYAVYSDTPKPDDNDLPIRKKEKEKLADTVKELLSRGSHTTGQVLQLWGPTGIGKRKMLESGLPDRKFLWIYFGKFSKATIPEIKELLKRIRRECLLTDAIPCFSGYEPPPVPEDSLNPNVVLPILPYIYTELKEEYPLSVWVSSEKADFLLKERLHVTFFEIPLLTATERYELWKHETADMKLDDDVDLSACANQYILTPTSMREVIANASIRGTEGVITKETIREAVADQVVNQLGTMASHIRSVYTWDDLVIEEKEKEHLMMICDQVRYRGVVGEEWGFHSKTAYGRGVCAMFYGQPGTGKTMAAQVVANELGLELYRIDLSQMVSKYIGETQKNITKLFERAKNTNAILFFDEADSLFSKRSEVRDSHDRNANAETAHLLQKLEDYEGITILATNYAQNIDDAFKRRIKFMVKFVFPEADVRRRLWKTILPDGAPQDESLDLDFFADNFELSGSNIKEVLTNAAYIAASRGRGLKNEDLVKAVKMNFEKHGKILSDSDFGYLIEE